MKKFLTIVTVIILGVLTAVNSAIFNFILSGPALIAASAVSWICAALLSFIIATNYARSYKTAEESKKMGDYFINIWGIIIFMALFGVGISFIGGLITYGTVTFIRTGTGGIFLNGTIFPILMFAVYLFGIYKNFIKFGFEDSRKKSFNLHFKALTLLLAVMFLMPSAILSNAYGTYYLQGGLFVDFRSLFSFNIDLKSIDDFNVVNTTEGLNMISVIVKVLFTFAIETAVAAIAYIRGKILFKRQLLSENKEYQTDEMLPVRKILNQKHNRQGGY
jgi:hypothetical protein